MFNYQDQLLLNLSSGSGAQGAVSFYRTRKNPRGGPDGGDGGQGGSIYFKADPQLRDFENLKKQKNYRAGNGENGAGQLKSGKNGKDLTLFIPIGTVIKNLKQEILRDFPKAKTELFLKGGQGGHGNAFFKNSLNQAPRHFQKGQKGQTQKVILELKPVVDIALIGKVNTGKSSFFNLSSGGKSKIASYPYTTLRTHVGELNFSEPHFFVMDIPGLEKNASQTVFKGLSFLRAIQRARLLLHFLDATKKDFLKDLKEIDLELKAFDKAGLKERPGTYFEKLSLKKRFYILTKSDELDKNRGWKEQAQKLAQKIPLKKGEAVFFLSNKSKKGWDEIMQACHAELKTQRLSQKNSATNKG